MFLEKSRLAFMIGSGFILAIIVGCASHTNPDVNASLQPLPSRPPGRPSPLMRTEQGPTTAHAGTGTLPAALLTQASVSTETPNVPTGTAPQPQLMAPSEYIPRGQTAPAQGPGEVPTLGETASRVAATGGRISRASTTEPLDGSRSAGNAAGSTDPDCPR